MDKEKFLSASVAVVFTAGVALSFSYLSANVMETYGLGIYLLVPFIGGTISAIVFNRKGRKRLGESASVAVVAGCVSLFAFLIVGFEGVLCLVMAAPVVIPLFVLGGLLGYAIGRAIGQRFASDITTLILVLLIPGFMGFESQLEKDIRIRSESTSIIIEGDPSEVWHEVVEFSPIPEPEDWMFRIGIAYPTHAEIEGTGVGAIRYCYFSTGAFVEPITHWEENRRLAFDVSEQPTPMTEISPYTRIHPPHLDWAVRSQRGEFLINDLGDGRVELVGTTWYITTMEPEPYWSWIAGKLVHKVHHRVLEHIKSSVESSD